MDQLDLDTDTRNMQVIYPPTKRADLLAILSEGWVPNSFRTQKETAKFLGHI